MLSQPWKLQKRNDFRALRLRRKKQLKNPDLSLKEMQQPNLGAAGAPRAAARVLFYGRAGAFSRREFQSMYVFFDHTSFPATPAVLARTEKKQMYS